MDLWPISGDFHPSDEHLFWTFLIREDGLVSFIVGDELGNKKLTFDLHASYVPGLVCMDIEHWKVICMPDMDRLGIPTTKAIVMQRYMQDLRKALVTSMVKADKGELHSGSWPMDILHRWFVRTWFNFTHSPFGREGYLEYCKKKNLVPYELKLTEAEWKKWFHLKAADYQLVEERLVSSTGSLRRAALEIEELSPFQILRSLPIWPTATESAVEYLRTRPLGDLVVPYLGTDFPSNVKMVAWPCGRVTALPWLNKEGAKENYDSDFVRKMATWKNGLPQKNGKMVNREEYVVIDLPNPPLPSHDKDNLIRSYLGDNRCILVRGQSLEGPASFSHEEIAAYKGSLAQKVQWQDATMRAVEFHKTDKSTSSGIHASSSLREFIDLAHDPNVCGNLLDMKAAMAPIPGLIARISDECKAWDMTHHESYAHLPSRTSSRGKSGCVPEVPSSEQPLVGPQAIRFDTGSMLRWTLLAHGGFVTYPHKDANGLCTWIRTGTGTKIWAILDPRYIAPDHVSRSRQLKLHEKMLHTPYSWDYEECSGRYSTFLAPGDMLIMPPGTWHAVYTSTPSVTEGGHFVLYDTLHLMEFSRAFDHKKSYFSTNSNHQIDRNLSRMTLALPTISQTRTFHRRPILALARMLLAPDDYKPQSEKKTPDLKLHPDDVLAREEHFELLEAQKILRQILKFVGVSEEELRTEVENNGVRWYERGYQIELPWSSAVAHK